MLHQFRKSMISPVTSSAAFPSILPSINFGLSMLFPDAATFEPLSFNIRRDENYIHVALEQNRLCNHTDIMVPGNSKPVTIFSPTLKMSKSNTN